MNISENMIPEVWYRRILPTGGYYSIAQGHIFKGNINSDAVSVRVSQDDFLDELYPSSHLIHSDKYLSKREIWEFTGQVDPKTGKKAYKFMGYDDVERVALGWQMTIRGNKKAHFAGLSPKLYNSTPKNRGDKRVEFENVQNWYDVCAFGMAWRTFVDSCFATGNGAIYIGIDKNKHIFTKVFSFLNGDVLYPAKDENGEKMLYRKYQIDNKVAIDILTPKSYQTWVQADESENLKNNWQQILWAKLTKNPIGTKSEDGYICIRNDKQLFSQFEYLKLDDVVWGDIQETCNSLEKSISFVSEEVKSSAFPILFAKGGNVTSLPSSKINGKTVVMEGNADDLRGADLKFVAPVDSANISEIDIKTKRDDIVRTSFTVEVPPELVKGSELSGSTLELLYAPEVKWCLNMQPKFQDVLNNIIHVLTQLVGVVEGRLSDYSDVIITAEQQIWTPKNEKELLQMVIDKYWAGAISRQSMIEEIGDRYVDDYETIWAEKERELELKNKFGSSTTSTESNPTQPAVDNRAENKGAMTE